MIENREKFKIAQQTKDLSQCEIKSSRNLSIKGR